MAGVLWFPLSGLYGQPWPSSQYSIRQLGPLGHPTRKSMLGRRAVAPVGAVRMNGLHGGYTLQERRKIVFHVDGSRAGLATPSPSESMYRVTVIRVTPVKSN